MGKVFSFMDKLVGIDREGNNQAARQQAAATMQAADMASRDARLQAAAAQSQIENQQALAAQQRKVNDLLGKPMESASVELGADHDDATDLLGRRGRNRYRNRGAGGKSGLKTGGGNQPVRV